MNQTPNQPQESMPAAAPNAAPFDYAAIDPVVPDVSDKPGRFAWTQDGLRINNSEEKHIGDDETVPLLGIPVGDPTHQLNTVRQLSSPTEQLKAVRAPSSPTERLQRVPSVRPNAAPRKIGRLITAGVVGLGLLASIAGLASRGGGSETAAPQSNDPEVSADQAPTTLGATVTTHEAAPSSTTVTSVALSPREQAPLTTVTTKAPAEKPAITTSAPATAKTPEAITPEKKVLAPQEVEKIIKATGYKGLEGHSFELADEEYVTKAARYVVINLDGTRDGIKTVVPMDEIKASIDRAEADAATRPTFTSKIQLGRGVVRAVTFQAIPAKLAPGGTDTRYIIYTNSDLDTLTAPVKGFYNSSTISRPYKDQLNVSLIRNQPGIKVDGFPANSFYTNAEIEQTTKHFDISRESELALDQEQPDMSYITGSTDPMQKKQALANVGREIYINSLAYAQASAEAGVPYERYKELAMQIPLRAYPDANVYYIAVSPPQYNTLG